MARITNDDKRARIDRVYRLIRQSPNGIAEADISTQLNISQRTVNNYLREDLLGKVYKDGTLWFADIPNPRVLRGLELEPEEGMAIYLAARQLVKQSDKRNVAAENALMKLAQIMAHDAQLGTEIMEAADELTNRPFKRGFEDIFRTIVQAYIYRRPVGIHYQNAEGHKFETIIEPYIIEPSALNSAIYVIAGHPNTDKIRTYRIGRINKATISSIEQYQIPPDFNGLEHLRSAWSIYYGEETVEVVLRFDSSVARRVQETHWHDSQKEIEFDDEGYAILKFEVADTTDLVPWIRTWGWKCEVLEPSQLRAQMIGDARRLADLYEIKSTHARNRYDDLFGDL